jgi:hypothetical protein
MMLFLLTILVKAESSVCIVIAKNPGSGDSTKKPSELRLNITMLHEKNATIFTYNSLATIKR